MPVPDTMQQYRESLEHLEQQKLNSTSRPSNQQHLTNPLKPPDKKTVVLATTSTPAHNPPKPTLLTIPPELGLTIFAHVFTTTSPTHTIDLRIISTSSVSRGKIFHAGLFPNDATPPPQTPLLICRQLHTDLKQAHAAAYQYWWTAQQFVVTVDSPFTLALLRPVTEKDLRHIHHLATAPVSEIGRKRNRVKILVHFSFEGTTSDEASLWRAAIERSPVCKARVGEVLPWHLTDCSRRDVFLRSLDGLVNDIREDSRGVEGVDPRAGRGLDAGEMHALSVAVWALMLEAGNA